MENNIYSVAVLGAGNIGSAVITRLQELDTDIVDINVTKVLVSDISKDRAVDKSLLTCLLYTSPSPRDISGSRMPSSA